MTKTLLFVVLILSFHSEAQNVDDYYRSHKDTSKASFSRGSVSNGSLVNGHVVPFSGENFFYFDSLSYTSGRAFLHSVILKSVLGTYKKMQLLKPGRNFVIMECSNQHGGKISPHRTHQNGLSIDFMSPLIKNNLPYHNLDSIGAEHYLLDFNSEGKLISEPAISIDFNLMALHILTLQEELKKNGYEIEKVILKINLKDDLFKTANGKKLKSSGIYFAQKLLTMIDNLHDDHYHIDFKPIQ